MSTALRRVRNKQRDTSFREVCQNEIPLSLYDVQHEIHRRFITTRSETNKISILSVTAQIFLGQKNVKYFFCSSCCLRRWSVLLNFDFSLLANGKSLQDKKEKNWIIINSESCDFFRVVKLEEQIEVWLKMLLRFARVTGKPILQSKLRCYQLN